MKTYGTRFTYRTNHPFHGKLENAPGNRRVGALSTNMIATPNFDPKKHKGRRVLPSITK